MKTDIAARHHLTVQFAVEQAARVVCHKHPQPHPGGTAERFLDDASGLLEIVAGSAALRCLNAVGCCCRIVRKESQHNVRLGTASPRPIHAQRRASGYGSPNPDPG